MAYTYGETPVHGLPMPLDGTPLDSTSWAHLTDALRIGYPIVCASAAEQAAYLAAATAAGLGPNSRRILRVCRTDLGRLVVSNDGTGWVRDGGGDFSVFTFTEASRTDTAGADGALGAFNIDLPAAAMIDVAADVLAVPPAAPAAWAFRIYLRDQTGRQLSTLRRRYSNLTGVQDQRDTVPAMIRQSVSMPAGAGQIQVWGSVDGNSGPIRWANVALSGSYA